MQTSNGVKRLLILHGWGVGSVCWQKVKELLERKEVEVLVPDLPGFGKEPPPKKVWGAYDYEKWTVDFIKDRGWDKFNLLGHSFGGGVAAVIAADYPELIEKLILCAPAVIRKKKKGVKTSFFYNVSRAGKKVFSLPVLKSFYPLAQRVIYKLCGSRDYYLASGIMKEVFKKVNEENLEQKLERIKIPTLILWGRKDDAVPVDGIYKIRDGIENSNLEIFSGTTHNIHQEMPEKLAKRILNFLTS